MKPFRLTRRALGSAVCMTLLAGTVLFTSPTPVHAAAQGKDTLVSLKSSKAPTNYFTPNILRKSWSRLVVSVVHLDALAFPVAAT